MIGEKLDFFVTYCKRSSDYRTNGPDAWVRIAQRSARFQPIQGSVVAAKRLQSLEKEIVCWFVVQP